MAGTDYNTLEGMRQLWRDFTGLSETADIADATINIIFQQLDM